MFVFINEYLNKQSVVKHRRLFLASISKCNNVTDIFRLILLKITFPRRDKMLSKSILLFQRRDGIFEAAILNMTFNIVLFL